jgi:phosphatidylglycerophosphate synthase
MTEGYPEIEGDSTRTPGTSPTGTEIDGNTERPSARAVRFTGATSNWNVPNLITVVRILLAPLFIWLLLADAGNDGALRWWAAGLFIVAIATDGIDGAIARRQNLVTDLGKLLDPIADKVLTGGALVGPVDSRRTAVVGNGRHPCA